MDTISADSAYVEAKTRTVGLAAALAVGAAAVAGAFGAGYVVAQTLDHPDPATVAETRAAAGHTFGAALTESLALKHRLAVRGEVADIRDRRVE